MTNDTDRAHGHALPTAGSNEPQRPVGAVRNAAERSQQRVGTDGGHTGGSANDTPELTTYTDAELGYSVEFPADWSADADPDGGMTVEVPDSTAAGAVVFVDEHVANDPSAYADRFRETLAADEHVHALERLDRRTLWLPGGHRGWIVEYAYVGDAPDDRWRLLYLFVVARTTGYTVGVDWAADAEFETVARTVVESFRLTTNSAE
jgi:hypothetical protein